MERPGYASNLGVRWEIWLIDLLIVQGDRVAKLLEEAFRDLFGLARQPADLAQDGLLLGGQVLGNDELHQHVLVAAAAASDVGHAFPGQPERLPVLRTGRDG